MERNDIMKYFDEGIMEWPEYWRVVARFWESIEHHEEALFCWLNYYRTGGT